MFVTKYSHWAYERELRAFVDLATTTKEGSLHFLPFSVDLRLKEVILGHLCPTSLGSRSGGSFGTRFPESSSQRRGSASGNFEVRPDTRYPAQ